MFQHLNTSSRALILALSLAAGPITAQAVPVTASTGDLGNNVISSAGLFEAFLNASSPSNALPASVDVKYGLWNSPDVLVSVAINGTTIGDFIANTGYSSPGPSFTTFDVTGLLLDGLNTISFNGFGASSGDYVVGQVDLNYDDNRASIPEPATLALLGMGILGMRLASRRKQAR